MYFDKELLRCIQMFTMANSVEPYPYPNMAAESKPTIADCLAVARHIFWKIDEDKREEMERLEKTK